MADPIDSEAYARAVETLLEGTSDRALIVSRRDFETIEGWRREGIPLAFVEEQWSELRTTGLPRSGRAPRLADLKRVIDEAWSVILDGRRGSSEPEVNDATGGHPPEQDRWGAVPEQAATPELTQFLREILAAHEAGADAHELDQRIDREIATRVPVALLQEVRAEVEEELDAYRNRMPAATLSATAERAISDRLRRRLQLARLAQQESD